MNKKDLILKKIEKTEKENEKNKLKRIIIAILGFTIIFFLILINNYEVNNIIDYMKVTMLSIVSSIIYFYVNMIIFTYIINKSYEENKKIIELKKKYEESE